MQEQYKNEKVLLLPNLITEKESRELILYLKKHSHLKTIGDGTDYTAINILHIHTQWVRDIFNRLSFDVIGEIYKNTGERVYPEMVALNEWDIGGVQEPHTDELSDVDLRNDNVKKDGLSREWTVILYINGHESFQGGETYFPDEGPSGEIITPVLGTGVVFRGVDLKHGVYPVRRGARYTISQWFTADRDRIITDSRTRDLSLDHVTLRRSET